MGVRSKPKFGFPIAALTACSANFEKSYLTQFLSELSRSYIDKMVSSGHLLENGFSTININRSQISSQLTLNGSNHSYFRLN